jgi:hypothetical protein
MALSNPLARIFSRQASLAESHISPPARGSGSRARVIVLVVVIAAVLLMVFLGNDVATAVGAVLAAGLAGVEIATRLLGAPGPSKPGA